MGFYGHFIIYITVLVDNTNDSIILCPSSNYLLFIQVHYQEAPVKAYQIIRNVFSHWYINHVINIYPLHYINSTVKPG
jgi:hypothetical protein